MFIKSTRKIPNLRVGDLLVFKDPDRWRAGTGWVVELSDDEKEYKRVIDNKVIRLDDFVSSPLLLVDIAYSNVIVLMGESLVIIDEVHLKKFEK